MLCLGTPGERACCLHLFTCGTYTVGQHSFILQPLLINIIQKPALLVAHRPPLDAAFAGYEKTHCLGQRAHIILCHPARGSQHLLIKPGNVANSGLYAFKLTCNRLSLRQLHALHHKALHLLAAEGHNNAPAAVNKIQLRWHSIGKLLKQVFYR